MSRTTIQEPSARIYLAAEKTASEDSGTSIAEFIKEDKLSVIGYSMACSSGSQLECRKNTWHLLVPIVGGIAFAAGNSEQMYLVAGQALLVRSQGDDLISVKNPFQNASIHFLHIELETEAQGSSAIFEQCTIDLTGEGSATTKMVRIFEAIAGLPFLFSATKLKGREEINHPGSGCYNNSMVYVAHGAIECEGRLLHAGDVLTLTNFSGIEMEALSEDAIVFLLEW